MHGRDKVRCTAEIVTHTRLSGVRQTSNARAEEASRAQILAFEMVTLTNYARENDRVLRFGRD